MKNKNVIFPPGTVNYSEDKQNQMKAAELKDKQILKEIDFPFQKIKCGTQRQAVTGMAYPSG